MGPHFLLFPQSLELWPTPKIPLLGDLQRDSLHQQNWLPMAQSTQRFAAVGQRLSRSEEHTSELQSLRHLVCRLLLEKKKTRLTQCRLHCTLTRRRGSTIGGASC